MELNIEPIFAAAAQESFAPSDRVFAVAAVHHVGIGEGAEGTYLGHLNEMQAVVDWDTPSGEPYRASLPFDAIRQLYK